MNFVYHHKRTKKLYKEKLSTIKQVYFTSREIDVITCIVNNRGEKKIASILSIAPRTVSTHVYNIMNKIGCNCKDQIIDFIEASGLVHIFREYYLNLLIKSKFEEKLRFIANRIVRNKLCVYCCRDDVNVIDTGLYKLILEDLKIANIELCELTSNNHPSSVGDNNVSELKFINVKEITEENYYNDILEKVIKIIDYDNKNELITEFYEYCKEVQKISEVSHNNIIYNQSSEQNFYIRYCSFIINNKQLFALILVVMLLVAIIVSKSESLTILEKESTNNDDIIDASVSSKIQALEDFLVAKNQKSISSNNTSLKQIRLNQGIIKKVEKILDVSNVGEIKRYFERKEVSEDILLNYLHNIHGLATFYLYNHQEGKKSRALLFYAKNLAENFINTRNKTPNDFSNMNQQEIVPEFIVIKNLAEIYTRIIYTLGRSYIYTDYDRDEAQKYFSLAKYMGSELKLFESCLSELSGFLVTDNILAEQHIKQKEYDSAKMILLKNLSIYKKIYADDTEYIIDYNPKLTEQKKIIPKDNPYNQFECSMRMVWVLSKLIEISDDPKEINHYIVQINNFFVNYKHNEINDSDNFIPNVSFTQMVKLVPNKKINDLYNKLGNLMLTLFYLKNDLNLTIEYESLSNNINKHLSELGNNINNNLICQKNELILAEKLFLISRYTSRVSYFTKSDAYKGLIKLYQFFIKYNNDHSAELGIKLNNQINILKSKLSNN